MTAKSTFGIGLWLSCWLAFMQANALPCFAETHEWTRSFLVRSDVLLPEIRAKFDLKQGRQDRIPSDSILSELPADLGPEETKALEALTKSKTVHPAEAEIALYSYLSLQQLKKIPSISSADRLKIARNWSKGSAFVWSGSSVSKSADDLAALLKVGFEWGSETTEIRILDLKSKVRIVAKPKTELSRLVYLAVPPSPYEQQKRALHNPKARDLNEVAGFLVFHKEDSGYCSLPFVGQGIAKDYWIYTGFPIRGSAGFIDGMSVDGRAEDADLVFENQEGRFSLRIKDDIDRLCEWKKTANPEQAPRILNRINRNYSLFNFQGLILEDPLNSGQAAAVVSQYPYVRRGEKYPCDKSEDKTWTLFGHFANEEGDLAGGIYAIEPSSTSPSLSATVYSLLHGKLRINEKAMNLSIFHASSPDKPKSMDLFEVPKTYSSMDHFYRWLAQEIQRDPF